MTTVVPVIACAAALAACAGPATSDQGEAPQRMRADVRQEIPHDRGAFTEGLELADGHLYEGTGLVGRSSIRAVDPATGAVQQQTALPGVFGEGITVVGPTLWQLTYTEGVAIQRDRATLRELRRVGYQGQGWGLCHDSAANRLVMSNGSDRLTFRDPQSFQPTGELRVTYAGRPLTQINELECAGGAVFANVWQTETIVRIDLSSGRVSQDINLEGLLPAAERAKVDVLNGIAAIPGTDEFLVTGKYWPKMFRVRFVVT
jgi:glutaminyl-peptide cyclotransferase